MLTLTIVAILLVAVLAHVSGGRMARDGGIAPALDTRAMAVFVFVATFGILWYSWAARTPIPVVHDELAYAFQAQVFARGLWALPPSPFPGFWEQPHVLVEPVVAAKYFPGHSLVLALGARAGWMPLMPLLMQSGIGVLLFVLARRVAGGAVALLAWVIWLFTPMVLYFGPSYYSEGTTGLCWLAGWFALLEWRATRHVGWLLTLATLCAWCAITRPLTAVAFAVPVGVVVLRDSVAGRRWRDLALALVLGMAVLSILPLWSAHTTGDWRVTPLALYTRSYMPFDVPGFGVNTTTPLRTPAPELAQWVDSYASIHVRHVPGVLLSAFAERVRYLYTSIWGATSGLLGVFAIIGLLTMGGEAAFAVGTSVLLIVVYLVYATPARWTLYYYEATPAFAYLSAAGLAWAASMIGRPRGVPASPDFEWSAPRWAGALTAAALVFALSGAVTLRVIRAQHIADRRFLARFDTLLASIHDPKAVVFARYPRTHNPLETLVQNVADPAAARIWVVFDRGEVANARLLATVPDRKAYLFDAALGRTYQYEP